MCGICGIANLHEAGHIQTQVMERMAASIAHRGPDDQGIFCDEHVGLGSRRLSIIDLAGGHQPIANEDETLRIVFNGEIYNYRELREHLLKLGHQFRTNSDTETILHLYEEYGEDCVAHLNGMFVFAIWNKPKHELFIARDRMGIKPLYYTLVNGELIYGSELKVLLQHPAVPRRVDLIALNEYLSYEYVPSPRTILRDIYRLPPGHWLRFRAPDDLHIQAYWDLRLARSEQQPPVHWRDYEAQLDAVLAQAVKSEMVSDVPIGVLLSGGLDSSTVAAYMVQAAQGNPVDSFSIGFEDASFDESNYARLVSKHVGTRHHELILTGSSAVDLTANITDFLDEPFADSSLIPTYLLSKFAREHVKVVLGGDGGDEMFAGYPTFIAHRMIDVYERLVPRFARAGIVPPLIKRMPVSFNNISLDFKIRRFLSGRGVPLQARHHRWLGSFVDEQKAELLQAWMKPALYPTYAPSFAYAAQCDAREPLNQLLYNDVKTYLEGDILFKVDRSSMAASLEVRVPLLNRDLVEFVMALPFSLKLHRLTSKYLLKRTMEGRLPREIIYRKKKGFNMPVARWFQNELRPLLTDMLSEQRISAQGYFEYAYVKRLLDQHLTSQRDNRKELWTLLMFQLWHQKVIG